MSSIIYIDPQSYNNLSLYDSGMMTAMAPGEVVLFGSSLWDCSRPNAKLKTWFKYNSKRHSISKGLSYLATILKIVYYVKKHPKIKVVHIQWLRLWRIDIIFAKWLKRRGIKVVFTAHNLLPHDSGKSQRVKYGIYYKTVDRICVHTETTKKELIEQFGIKPEKIEIIPHGIIYSDIMNDTVVSLVQRYKMKHDISSETLVISSLGIQSFYKGVDILIKVWSKEKELYSNTQIKLLIVGRNSGLDFNAIKNLQNVIIIDDKVSNEDFQAFLEISDVILLPYRKISQSGVLFSAIARNKPVMVSNVGGLPDPLKIGNIGWNIGSVNEDSLRTALLDIIRRPEIVKSMQMNDSEFQKVKDYYSWESISLSLKRMYENLF